MASWLRRSRRIGNSVNTYSRVALHLGGVVAQIRAEQQVVVHAQAPEQPAAFGHVRDAAAEDAVGGPRRDVLAGKCDAAGRGRHSGPRWCEGSVVLPAPLEPTMQVISPAATVEVDVPQHADVAIAGGRSRALRRLRIGSAIRHLRIRRLRVEAARELLAEISLDDARIAHHLRAAGPSAISWP